LNTEKPVKLIGAEKELVRIEVRITMPRKYPQRYGG
jgi:hypothetical protein